MEEIPNWIIRNLKEKGNCFQQMKIYKTKDIEKVLGKKVKYRKALSLDSGYVIEVIKR